MKFVDPTIYDKEYYLSKCLGSENYKASKGMELHPRVKNLLKQIPINNDSVVLDVGCGRGDVVIHIAKKARKVYGIDYSKDAIDIANKTKKSLESELKRKIIYKKMNAKKLDFPDNYFNVVVSIDVFEHLYKNELNIAIKEIKRVLKNGGILFVDTNTNRWLYDFTYNFYIRPMNNFLSRLDMLAKKSKYLAMPSDPRIADEKIQHVNEPTYFYLRNLFKNNGFNGKISTEPGYLKSGKSIRTRVYNFLTTLYPLSRIFPLNLLFSWSFICVMRNDKEK